ncbi:hypothetical protein KTN05_09630 [Paracoccus sp. Z118]|uniref:hypothetical protein n=1 Tax=Paracoccus sp. Z118 TaxID=2851017 RepID=UPI001C2B97DD|nr:hypothetical protein [Paracoccus sp. Z118]MBV0892111.1 hypothetical protein [Paracoccus sp. Z118]
MTPEIVGALHDPRLPEAFTRLTIWDLLLALGLGLLLAALVLTLAAPLLSRRVRRPSLSGRLGHAASLPEGERLLALARIARERGVALPDEARAALYSGQCADPAWIEALIRAGARR